MTNCKVEVHAYSGPHRRLWQGPQFSFYIYNEDKSTNLVRQILMLHLQEKHETAQLLKIFRFIANLVVGLFHSFFLGYIWGRLKKVFPRSIRPSVDIAKQ